MKKKREKKSLQILKDHEMVTCYKIFLFLSVECTGTRGLKLGSIQYLEYADINYGSYFYIKMK